MENLPNWNLSKGLPASNDFETKTAIEKVYLLYNKVNSMIKAFNEFVSNVDQKIKDYESKYENDLETFTTSLRQEFQDFIDVVDLKLQEKGE